MKKIPDLDTLLGNPTAEFEKFHHMTKWTKLLPSLEPEKWPKEWKTTYFKEYPRLDKIILPEPSGLGAVTLEDAYMRRKSKRVFSKKPLSLETLSNLLYYSCGLRDNKPPWAGNRTYASPGARYTLEVYVISKNTELAKGVYHYNLRSHSLETLVLGRFRDNNYFNQDWILPSNCIILFTAVFKRNTIKYGERGYRHVLAESGHLGQNFYLTATALGLNICAIGGYLDDGLNELLGVDGVSETVIYALATGYQKDE